MAVAYLAGSAVTLFNTTSVGTAYSSYSYDAGSSGADRCLVVSVGHENGVNSPTGITYAGAALTLQETVTVNPSDGFSETIDIWTLTNPATGINTLAISGVTGNGRDGAGFAAVYTGVNQATPTGNKATRAELAGTNGLNVAINKTSADSAIVWAFCYDQGASTFGPMPDNVLLFDLYTVFDGYLASSFGFGYQEIGSGVVITGAEKTGSNGASGSSDEDNAVVAVELIAAGVAIGTDNITAQNLQAQASTTTATLTQSHQLTPASLQAATSTTSATLAQVHILTPVSLTSASNTTAGVLAQAHTLEPTDLTSTATTSTPALAQIHTLIPVNLTSQSSTTNTSLSDQSTVDNLTATGLQASTSTTSPALTQAHNLAASDTASQSSTSTPTLAQVHTLNPANLTTQTSTTTATLQSIAGQDSLAAAALTAGTSTTTGTLAQVHTLTPQNLASGTSTTTASITQVHGLTAANVISITSTTSPILRNASVVLARPITNTKATPMTTERKAVTIQADYKVRVG